MGWGCICQRISNGNVDVPAGYIGMFLTRVFRNQLARVASHENNQTGRAVCYIYNGMSNVVRLTEGLAVLGEC